MIKIWILEDEVDQARLLVDYLRRYESEHDGLYVEITCYDRAIQLLEEYRGDTDLLLMDIRVPDMLGMEAARRVRQIDSSVVIIFVTSLSQFAIEGYSVGALDYILKPVAYAPFAAKLERALRVLAHSSASPSLVLRTRDGQQRLSAAEILYLEVMDHDVSIHVQGGGVFRQWGSLSQFEEQLKDAHFVRCNACYLVNLKYVCGIEEDCVVVGGERLAISKPRRKAFLRAFAQYRGGSR